MGPWIGYGDPQVLVREGEEWEVGDGGLLHILFCWTQERERDGGVAGWEGGVRGGLSVEMRRVCKCGFGGLWLEADNSTLTLPDSKKSKRITPRIEPGASGHCNLRVNASNVTPALPCRLL